MKLLLATQSSFSYDSSLGDILIWWGEVISSDFSLHLLEGISFILYLRLFSSLTEETSMSLSFLSSLIDRDNLSAWRVKSQTAYSILLLVYLISSNWFSRSCSFDSKISIILSLSTILLQSAMLTAVSRLSPVRIQTVIPAIFKDVTVSWTSYCNLSSIPVAPSRVRFYSISSMRPFSIISFWSPTMFYASSNWSCHMWKYSTSKDLYVMTSVLSPSFDILWRLYWRDVISSDSADISLSILRRGITTESAPFVRSTI